MKTNAEMRQEARAILRDKWFWRLLVAGFFLQSFVQVTGGLVKHFNQSRGVTTWDVFLQKKLEAMRQGLDYILPTQDAYHQMWVATGFESFVAIVFGAIALFGLTAVALRAIAKDEKGWIAAGLGGFRRPLGVTVLLFVQNLIVGFWALFLIVPGIVMAYRYRLSWYLAVEHPDWGVFACLRESAKRMMGFKGRALLFDLYYIALLTPAFLAVLVGYALTNAGGLFALVGLLVSLAGFVAFLHTLVWFVVGRAVFYREIVAAHK